MVRATSSVQSILYAAPVSDHKNEKCIFIFRGQSCNFCSMYFTCCSRGHLQRTCSRMLWSWHFGCYILSIMQCEGILFDHLLSSWDSIFRDSVPGCCDHDTLVDVLRLSIMDLPSYEFVLQNMHLLRLWHHREILSQLCPYLELVSPYMVSEQLRKVNGYEHLLFCERFTLATSLTSDWWRVLGTLSRRILHITKD